MESLPSKNAALLDVPEVRKFTGNFQYNFWTFDEFENGLGSINSSFTTISSETSDASFLLRTRSYPRFINLTWNPILINVNSTKVSIKGNIDKIHSEETFTSNDYSSISYQDNQTDDKLKFFMDQFIGFLTGSNTTSSPMSMAEFVNDHTSNEITSKFTSEILANLQNTKGILYAEGDPKSIENAFLNKLKNVVINTKINNRILTSVTKTISEDSLGLFSDEFSENKFTKQIEEIQDHAIANENANLFSPLDYEFEILSYIDYKPVDTVGYEPIVQTLGYVLEKREIKSDGTEETYPLIVIESPLINIYTDPQVRYGSLYYYKIKAIYLVEVHAIDEIKKQNLLVSFLVSSRSSKEQEIKTVEMMPPPSPADFNLAWDYGIRALRCSWSLPVNPQRDIKYIQLFRRSNINEPFQLIKMWDFNDSITKIQLSEYPSPELLEKTESFVGIYIDHQFGKDSKYIYAVCAIDAHGLTSNYSIQFEVSFDKFGNKLVKKLISVSGAPKQYPNAFLNRDTFVDSIKDSGHSNIRLIFNPEYMQLVDGQGNDLNLLKSSQVQGKYRIQLINVDFQTQANVDVTLNDLRTTQLTKQVSNQNILPKIVDKSS